MGKLKGIVQLTGNLDGLSFYELNGKIVVRKTGGFNGEKIKKEANYARTRENSSEFAQCARAGKYFRDSIAKYLKPLRFTFGHNAVLQLFQEISKLDAFSERGKRTASNGLRTAEAKKLVTQFEFDKTAPFSRVFPFKFAMNWEQERLVVQQFIANGLTQPSSATHVAVTYFTLGLDFEQQTRPILQESPEMLFDLNTPATTPTDLLLPCTIPDSPTVFGLLSVCFFQEVNGEMNRLVGGALKVVGCS